MAKRWIAGDAFGTLREMMVAKGVKVGLGVRPRDPSVAHIVEMGENAVGYEGAHVIGAISAVFDYLLSAGVEDSDGEHLKVLRVLQKRLKYGLPAGPSILLYEAGFADRPLAVELAKLMPQISSRNGIGDAIRDERAAVKAILDRYPQYFAKVFERVTR